MIEWLSEWWPLVVCGAAVFAGVALMTLIEDREQRDWAAFEAKHTGRRR